MSAVVYMLIWIVPSMLISIVVGAYIGYSFALRRHSSIITEERDKTLAALQHVLESAEELSSGVDQHNSDLATVEHEVSEISDGGNYEHFKNVLLTQIAEVVESNRKLEDDLVYTKYRLEEQAQELDRTRVEARTDALSGVGNRKAFDEALQFMLSQMHRSHIKFALLLIDVDHFKWINDTHGHHSGDLVVQRLGETLQSCVRPTDCVARYGGDEFAILFPGVSLDVAEMVTHRMRERIAQTNFHGDNEAKVAVTLSLGLAIAEPEDTTESVFRKADAALYRSKEAGRNRLTVFTQEAGTDMLNACPERDLTAPNSDEESEHLEGAGV